MRIDSFEWDEGNVGHIARHRVTWDEVEEIFDRKLHVRRGRDGRYEVLGRNAAGRYLFCVLEWTSQAGQVRIITARDMVLRERRLYLRNI